MYHLTLTDEQMDFLRQTLDQPSLVVPVKLARVAGETHALIVNAKRIAFAPMNGTSASDVNAHEKIPTRDPHEPS